MRSTSRIGDILISGILCTAVLLVAASAEAQEIRLKHRTFTPKPGIEEPLAISFREVPAVKRAVLLQFTKRLTLEEHKLIAESGIELEGYLGSNAYVAALSGDSVVGKPELEKLIRAIEPFQKIDKLSVEVARKEPPKWALDTETKKHKVLVEFFRFLSPNVIRTKLKGLGLTGRRFAVPNTWEVQAPPNMVAELSSLGMVKQIQYGPTPFLPLNETGRRVANTDQVQLPRFGAGLPQYDGITGEGVRIGIADTGVDQNHDDFREIDANGNAVNTRVYNQRPGGGSHGTHVASIAAGNGFQSGNNGYPAFSLRGHAPEADIGDYPQFGGDVSDYSDAIGNDGTDVTNHSYVQAFTVYDAEAESLDSIIRGDAVDNNGNTVPPRPQVWAAGNNGLGAQYGNEEGYYAIFTSAKNSISVGSVDTHDRRISDFTSLGPTFDGRVKPDIVAPGCNSSVSPPNLSIVAAQTNTQGYTTKCGTSMAAPVVSGIIGLMMDQYQDTYGVEPNLQPATYKAMLVHSAHDMVKTEAFADREFNNPDTGEPVVYHAGPDFATGYGLVDAHAARQIVADSPRWTEGEIGKVGKTFRRCFRVPAGSNEVKVVLAWDDEPGSTLTAETQSKLVNDLDLELVAPNNTIYRPWKLHVLPLTANPGDGARDPIATSDVQPAFRGIDRLNNVEMASVPLPMPGYWKVRVRAHTLPNGNVQPFSLVSSHDFVYRPLQCFPKFVGPICKRFPWICKDYPFTRIVKKGASWIVPPKEPVFVPEICKYVSGLNCPGCEGQGWKYCPGWQLRFDHLPPEAVVQLIDDKGNIVQRDASRKSTRILRLKQRLPGDTFAVLFTDDRNSPYSKPLKIGIRMERLR